MTALPIALAMFEHEWMRGDRDLARQMADEYIGRHYEQIAPFLEPLTIPELVDLIDRYRDEGVEREGDRIIADMWLLSRYEPQRIVGAFDIRLPGPRALMQGGR